MCLAWSAETVSVRLAALCIAVILPQQVPRCWVMDLKMAFIAGRLEPCFRADVAEVGELAAIQTSCHISLIVLGSSALCGYIWLLP